MIIFSLIKAKNAVISVDTASIFNAEQRKKNIQTVISYSLHDP
ncbi:MAG: hypothetical protein ACI9XO_000593 [Paraglaciecola sp.]|jgi:hypothetical protein